MFFSYLLVIFFFLFFSSRRRHTRWNCDWSSDVCSSDLDRQVIDAAAREFREGDGKEREVHARDAEPEREKADGRAKERAGRDREPDARPRPDRSEERRVGKECRSRWSPEQ